MTDFLIDNFDAIPKKNIIKALLSDTDKYTAILELIDNSYTSWLQKELSNPLNIIMEIDNKDQILKYIDNAGGMNIDDIKAFLRIGDTTAEEKHRGISLYGVGAKRSSFFLSDTFEVITRRNNEKTLKVTIPRDWLNENSWKYDIYGTDDIEPNSTILTFKEVKFSLDDTYVIELSKKISSSFRVIIGKNFSVSVNGKPIESPPEYEWAYLPWFKPSKHHYKVTVGEMIADVTFTLGLLNKSSQVGNYGFDIICNGRLIVENLRDPEIGFREGELGKPHARLARFKGLIEFNGPVGIMPWNSTKTGLDYSKPLFKMIKERLIMYSKPYIRESNRQSVEGSSSSIPDVTEPIKEIDHGDIRNPKNDYTIPDKIPDKQIKKKQKGIQSSHLPKFNRIITENKQVKKLIDHDDIYRALFEGVYVPMKLIKISEFDYRNRFAFIIMDNTCELMLKKYLREKKKMNIGDANNYFDKTEFKKLVEDARKQVNANKDDDIWERIKTFREQRNMLNHVYPELTVPDSIIEQYKHILIHLFKLFFDLDLTGK